MNTLKMFKAYDIRTKIENLTDEDLVKLAKSIALYYRDNVKTKRVVVARDARLYCPRVMEEVIKALTEYGLDVLINPLQTSTCQFYFMCLKTKDAGGIMLTASHNPGVYIGCKFVGPNVTPIASGCGIDGGINKIKEYFISNNFPAPNKNKGKLHYLNLQKEYIDYSMKLAGVRDGDLKGLKIFGEFLSGAAGSDFLAAFDRAGAELELSHIVPDGFFPSGDPNPIIESSIAPAREKLKNGSFDLGFCFDGDGDRLDTMYSDGSQVIPGLNMAIIIPYLKEIFYPHFGSDFDYKVYVDVKAIPLALIEIAKSGVDQHIIRNGHSFIKEKLTTHYSEGFIASEEESAHYYMNFPFNENDINEGTAAIENTLFFALITARAYKEHKDKYQRAYEIQKGINRFREWPLNFRDGDRMDDIMAEVEAVMVKKGAAVIKTMDDGSDLDATLMRFNLPTHFKADSDFPSSWCQVAQRISRSEDAMTRWEVVASSQELCEEFNSYIKEITDRYVKEGIATY